MKFNHETLLAEPAVEATDNTAISMRQRSCIHTRARNSHKYVHSSSIMCLSIVRWKKSEREKKQ